MAKPRIALSRCHGVGPAQAVAMHCPHSRVTLWTYQSWSSVVYKIDHKILALGLLSLHTARLHCSQLTKQRHQKLLMVHCHTAVAR